MDIGVAAVGRDNIDVGIAGVSRAIRDALGCRKPRVTVATIEVPDGDFRGDYVFDAETQAVLRVLREGRRVRPFALAFDFDEKTVTHVETVDFDATEE